MDLNDLLGNLRISLIAIARLTVAPRIVPGLRRLQNSAHPSYGVLLLMSLNELVFR